jgi:hypothetical protein
MKEQRLQEAYQLIEQHKQIGQFLFLSGLTK